MGFLIWFALELWNGFMQTTTQLLTLDLETIFGTELYTLAGSISQTLATVAATLFTIIFLIGLLEQAASFQDMKRPEFLLRSFLRFALTNFFIVNSTKILTEIFNFVTGIINLLEPYNSIPILQMPDYVMDSTILSSVFAIFDIFGNLLILIIAIVMISVTFGCVFQIVVTIYGRVFRLYSYIFLAPLAFAMFASKDGIEIMKRFFKSFLACCFEALVIVILFIIFGKLVNSGFSILPDIISDNNYHAIRLLNFSVQTMINMTLLAGLIKGSDYIVKEVLVLG